MMEQYEAFVDAQIALLKSPFIRAKTLEHPDAARLEIVRKQHDKMVWLERQLRAERIRNSEIVQVSIKTNLPEASETILNAAVEAYFEFLEEVYQRDNTIGVHKSFVGICYTVLVMHFYKEVFYAVRISPF